MTVRGWLRSFSRTRNTSKSNRQVHQQSISRGPLKLEQLELRAMVSHAIGEHAPHRPPPLPAHPTLRIVIDGQDLTIPADIGVTPTRLFAYHTHDTSGQLHYDGNNAPSGLDPIGSAPRFTTLDDFFDVWRETGTPGTPQNNPNAFFSSTRIMDRFADATHAITFTVNGQPNNQFENYSLHPEDDAVISFDTVQNVNQRPTGNAQNVTVLPESDRNITLTGDDGDAGVTQSLSFRVQSLPANGLLLDSNDNPVTVGSTLTSATVNYTPNPGFTGSDSFTFDVMDDGGTADGGQDTSTAATVSITVAPNQRPTANAQTVSASQNTAKSITLGGDDGDAGLVQNLTVSVRSLPANGTLRDSNGNAVTTDTLLPSANLTYTPNAEFTGSDSFTFTVQDDGGSANGGQDFSTPATVSLNVAPQQTNPPGTPGGTVRLRDGDLKIHGGPEDNVFDVALSADGDQLEVDTGSGPQGFDLTDFRRLCMEGREGDDTISLDPDVEVPAHILGGRGSDEITGGSGPDRIRGGRGGDVIDGGDGNDVLRGRRGADVVMGGEGNDWLRGGRGADSMDGGAGSDIMHGGRGTDTDMNPDPADRVFGMP
jgi:Ca2+-binding RTX toxin-like protein